MDSILEVVVRPPAGESIRSEFRNFIVAARECGWSELHVMFGFAWGSDVYPQNWQEEVMSPDELDLKVREVEDAGFGSIGDDDLHVTVVDLGVEFRFCHENDLHICGVPDCSFISDEKVRFLNSGWYVVERIKGGSSGTDWRPVESGD